MQNSVETATAIGLEVRRVREAHGLRQDELALAAGVSTRAVHQIESGKPTTRFDILVRVTAALGLGITVSSRHPVKA